MGSRYAHLSAEERGVIMVMRSQGSSIRKRPVRATIAEG